MKKSPAAHVKSPPASVGGGAVIGNQVASALDTFRKLTTVASSTGAVDVSFEYDDKRRSEAKASQSSPPSLSPPPKKLTQRMPQLAPFVEKALQYSFTDSPQSTTTTTGASSSGTSTTLKRKTHPTPHVHKDTCTDKDSGDALDIAIPVGKSDVMMMRERRQEREGAKVRFDITKGDGDIDGNARERGGGHSHSASGGVAESSYTFATALGTFSSPLVSQNRSLILPPIAISPASRKNNSSTSVAGRFRFLSQHGEGPSERIANSFGAAATNTNDFGIGSGGSGIAHPNIYVRSREGGRLNPDLLAICKALDEASREIENILALNAETGGGDCGGDVGVGVGGGRERGTSRDNQNTREGGNGKVSEKTSDRGMTQHKKVGGTELVERARAPSQVSVNSTTGAESTCSSTGAEKASATFMSAKETDTVAPGVVRKSNGFTPADPHLRQVTTSVGLVAAPSSPTLVLPPLDDLRRLYALHRDACREASRVVLHEHTRDDEEARSGRASPRSHQREALRRSPSSPPSPRGERSISSFSFLFDVIQATLRTSDAYILALMNQIQEGAAERREAIAERNASDALISALKQKVTALEMVLEGVDSAAHLKEELVKAKREITVLKRQIYAFEETKKEVALVVNELGNQLFAAKASTALTEQALRAEIAALNNQLSLYQRGARGGRRSTTGVEEEMITTAAVLRNAQNTTTLDANNKDAGSTLLSRFSSDNYTNVIRDNAADTAGIDENNALLASTWGLGLGPRNRVDTGAGGGDDVVGVSAALAALRNLPLSAK